MQESAEEREQIVFADSDHEAARRSDLTWAMAVRTGCWFLAIGLLLAAIACLTEGGLYWPHWIN
jgi:hypothetical protein